MISVMIAINAHVTDPESFKTCLPNLRKCEKQIDAVYEKLGSWSFIVTVQTDQDPWQTLSQPEVVSYSSGHTVRSENKHQGDASSC